MEEIEKLKATKLPNEAVLRHLRLDPAYTDTEEIAAIGLMRDAAVSYVKERCNIDEQYADDHPDIAIAVLVLVRDMYDNRQMYVDKTSVNRTVESILSLHDFNLL
ncbi:head-tail connector protein [Eggerthella timonensis]|uniref:head-tail connector protein n=1 Tax=Eggerthella timonensis TaxID=1871008 RepID=UPI000C7690EC|nr:head-tail connector protein [Eggerthella timonensis]